MNYEDFKKQYIISKGDTEVGFSFHDIQEVLLTPAKYKEFELFMNGQTCSLIGGISICYPGDLYKFMKGLPNTD